MPTFETFLDQMKAAGVQILNEGALTTMARQVSDWPAVVADVAVRGRKQGIIFERVTADVPTDDGLETILSDFSFTPQEARAVIDNTFPMGAIAGVKV
ncbi:MULTISPECIES: hypothetical protein [Burkholderia]|jgi:hypothetical protein|uniref:Uncharacterized protein n=3 Tax=Burkholderia cepacia complex TaxID=87882 RepID=A0A250LLD5_9BURK|nr:MULTISPECIES: hypothetical protein [Burkholderia]KKL36272.1 hypothetical protein WR31_23915 [Burkholderia contaminans LMG 23361]MBA9833700.1 hypothetical protein [Burkholderia contaminans]MBA9841974.1 hypothetical protein [Burkholderia contaminans]MBA9866872.1 hypothetical protein [Burkholderia contaminans]MBA9909596.1 hypothetical protein [Burkholderia contaminans]